MFRELEFSSNQWFPSSRHVTATVGVLSVVVHGNTDHVVTPAKDAAEFLALKPGWFGGWKVEHRGTRAECIAFAMKHV